MAGGHQDLDAIGCPILHIFHTSACGRTQIDHCLGQGSHDLLNQNITQTRFSRTYDIMYVHIHIYLYIYIHPIYIIYIYIYYISMLIRISGQVGEHNNRDLALFRPGQEPPFLPMKRWRSAWGRLELGWKLSPRIDLETNGESRLARPTKK